MLVFMSAYAFLIQGFGPPSQSQAVSIYRPEDLSSLDPHHHSEGPQHHRKIASALKLTPEEELAAISSFIASQPRNVLPPDVNPSLPIDPQLVLDFDINRGPRTTQEVHAMVQDVWTRNPVFVYSQVRVIRVYSRLLCANRDLGLLTSISGA